MKFICKISQEIAPYLIYQESNQINVLEIAQNHQSCLVLPIILLQKLSDLFFLYSAKKKRAKRFGLGSVLFTGILHVLCLALLA